MEWLQALVWILVGAVAMALVFLAREQRRIPDEVYQSPLSRALASMSPFSTMPRRNHEPGEKPCKWRLVGVQTATLEGRAHTIVLQRCDEHEEVRSTPMLGEWTLGQLEGREEHPSKVVDKVLEGL